MARLDMDASFSGAVTLVEWAERLQEAGVLPETRLDVVLMVLPEEAPSGEHEDDSGEHEDDSGDRRVRQLRLVPHGDQWCARLQALVPLLEGDCLVTVCQE